MKFSTWWRVKLGKLVLKIAKVFGNKNPKLTSNFITTIYPDFLKNTLGSFGLGTILICGSNGKKSTAKILSQLLIEQGFKVFTNLNESNSPQDIITALLKQCDQNGSIKSDLALIELNEDCLANFTEQITPKYSLFLNLDPNSTKQIKEAFAKLTEITTDKVVVNRENKQLRQIVKKMPVDKLVYYGYSDRVGQQLQDLDDELSASELPNAQVELVYHGADNTNVYRLKQKKLSANFKISGLYNHLNIAGALATVQELVGDNLDLKRLEDSLKELKPAFGRGERFLIGGQATELILVKNPSSFQMSLNSLAKKNTAIMIAINDNLSDGCDTSWLWDVDFTTLPHKSIFMASGTRCYDVANRLKYDSKKVSKIESNIDIATRELLTQNTPRQIYGSYTAIFQIRKILLSAVKGEKS